MSIKTIKVTLEGWDGELLDHLEITETPTLSGIGDRTLAADVFVWLLDRLGKYGRHRPGAIPVAANEMGT